MKITDVIEHFGSKAKACEAIDVQKQTATVWGFFIPKNQAKKIEEFTGGELSRNYEEKCVEVDGKTYKTDVDINYLHTFKEKIDKLFFVVDGVAVRATSMGIKEAVKSFRKRPVYVLWGGSEL